MMSVIAVVIMIVMVVAVMMGMLAAVAVEVGHVVIVVFVGGVEFHVKITGVNSRNGSAADGDSVAVQRQAVEHLLEDFAVGTEIEHRADSHVPGNAGAAFKIKLLCHKCPSFRLEYRLLYNNFIN